MAASEQPGKELKTYTGHCHCGAFKFKVKVPEIDSAIECNCSMCSKNGFCLIFPDMDALTIERGEETLETYNFNSNTLNFKFCPTCGSLPIARRAGDNERCAINVRCLQDVDIWSLKLNEFDGASLPVTSYKPASLMEHTLKPGDNQKVYTGSCHCGAVRVAMMTTPLPQAHVGEDHCSICVRNAYTSHYLPATQVQFEPKDPPLTRYSFGPHAIRHCFCPTCSMLVCIEKAQQPKEGQADHLANKMGINLRCLEGVEWEAGKVGAQGTEGAEGTVYVVRRRGDWGEPYVVA